MVFITPLVCHAQEAEQPDATAVEAPEEGATDDPLVTNSFWETDLRQALGDTAMAAGVSIIADDTVAGYITLDLVDVPLSEALERMLVAGGFVYARAADGTYLVTSADPQAPLFAAVAETRIVPLHYTTAEQIGPLLPERVRQFILPDPQGHRMVVEAPERMMPDIVERIQMLDARPGQVMIEAMVIETSAGALREFDTELATSHFGVSASGGILRYESIPQVTSGSTNGNGTISPSPGNIILGLRWLLSNNKAQMRACPRIVALDGEEALIEVGTEQYFSILTGSAAYAYTRLEKIDATISLQIQPRIIADTGEVHCVIKPNVSDVAGTGEGGLPVITVRRAESTVRLTDGEAVMIGGLIEDQTTVRKSEVPLLSDIPLVGELFKSTRKTHEQREIVILIAPHILDEGGQTTGPLLGDALLGAAQSEEPPAEASDAEDAEADEAARRRRPAPTPPTPRPRRAP
jgi:type II secretory pathway component GspD/PulD (secretin)